MCPLSTVVYRSYEQCWGRSVLLFADEATHCSKFDSLAWFRSSFGCWFLILSQITTINHHQPCFSSAYVRRYYTVGILDILFLQNKRLKNLSINSEDHTDLLAYVNRNPKLIYENSETWVRSLPPTLNLLLNSLWRPLGHTTRYYTVKPFCLYRNGWELKG
jgi:hypothetical protein